MNSNKRKIDSVLGADERIPELSLLSFLRRYITGRDARLLCSYKAGEILIDYQSEFPLKIQDEIQNALEEEGDLGIVRGRVVSTLMRLWGGLDSEIDTEEQVEVVVRLFPHLLDIEGKGFINGRKVKKYPLFWVLSCSKSLPFVPLFVEMIFELSDNSKFYKWHKVRSVLEYKPVNSDDEYERKLDEASLLTVKRLIERGIVKRGDVEIYNLCTTALTRRPSRIEKTLKFLLDWDPTVLKGKNAEPRGRIRDNELPLLYHSYYLSKFIGEEEALKRFRMLFELGMVHYPEDMGFLFHVLFHKNTCFQNLEGRSIFEWASDNFGNERVNQIVEEVLLRTIRGNFKKLQTLMVSIAGRDDMVMDAWYFLCRLHPAALMPSVLPPRT